MSKTINKVLIAVAIFCIVAFLVIAGVNPVFAEEAAEATEQAVENESTVSNGVEWLRSLSVDEIKGWIGAGIAFLSTGVGAIILLVIKVAYDSVKKVKMQAEIKKANERANEAEAQANNKILEVCNKILESEEATQNKTIEMMSNFAKQYDVKLTSEVNNAVASQKKVLDAYAEKIKELEENE